MATATKRKKNQKTKEKSIPNADFRALVDFLYGSMSWLNVTVDDYLREKHYETDAEHGD